MDLNAYTVPSEVFESDIPIFEHVKLFLSQIIVRLVSRQRVLSFMFRRIQFHSVGILSGVINEIQTYKQETQSSMNMNDTIAYSSIYVDDRIIGN